MVNFIAVDLTLLVLFIVLTSIFLYKKRKNLGQEGWLMLYRTSWGLKLINYIGGKYKKTLKVLSYVSIFIGYVLMVGILILIINSVVLYLTTPIASIIRGPPVAPLIPYFPKIFGLESFFPAFYFVDFIIAILIVATVHEFAHGIFAKRYNIRIKSTGFAFLKYLPAVFGAFVEQDERDMVKKTKFEQMSVLSAGVFANVIVAILFYIILFWFFSVGFSAAGVGFNTYSYDKVDISKITSVNGIPIQNPSYENILDSLNEDRLNKFGVNNQNYVTTKEVYEKQKGTKEILILYHDAPAINAELGTVISEINGVKIDELDKLQIELSKYSPGDHVEVKTIEESGKKTYDIELAAHPKNESRVWLGIGFSSQEPRGIIGNIFSVVPSYKEQHIYYEPKSEFNEFFKDLLWWIVIINILVAFFNMLPLGILDGGRFFYLTILGITRNEKLAKRSFSFITWSIVLLFLILMVKWVLVRF